MNVLPKNKYIYIKTQMLIDIYFIISSNVSVSIRNYCLRTLFESIGF